MSEIKMLPLLAQKFSSYSSFSHSRLRQTISPARLNESGSELAQEVRCFTAMTHQDMTTADVHGAQIALAMSTRIRAARIWCPLGGPSSVSCCLWPTPHVRAIPPWHLATHHLPCDHACYWLACPCPEMPSTYGEQRGFGGPCCSRSRTLPACVLDTLLMSGSS